MDLTHYFDPYALVGPQGAPDILSLLGEALRELHAVNDHLQKTLSES